jgi:hypothetical protein
MAYAEKVDSNSNSSDYYWEVIGSKLVLDNSAPSFR